MRAAAVLILNKTDFQSKILGQRRRLYKDKRVNLPKRYSNYKYICTKYQSPKSRKHIRAELKRETDNRRL